MDMPPFSPTEQKVLDVLNDGEFHKREELVSVLEDDDDIRILDSNSFHNCLFRIRKKLELISQDLQCRMRFRETSYRHIKITPISSSNGRKSKSH